MPDKDIPLEKQTNEDYSYDPTSVGGEIDEEMEVDLSGEDRGDGFTPTDNDALETTNEAEPDEDEEAEAESEDDAEAEDTPDGEVEDAESEDDESEDNEAESEDEKPEGVPESEDVDDEEEETKPSENRIPKQRFDQVNERRKEAELKARELEARLAALEAQAGETGEKAPEFDFDAKEQEYMELALDGEFDKAKVVRAEIRAAELQQVQAMTAQVKEESVNLTQERNEYMAEVQRLESEYLELNPNHELADPDMIDEVLDMKDAFLSKPGNVLNNAQALAKAAKYVTNMYGVKSIAEMKSEVDEVPESKPDPKKSVKEKPTDIKKKVKAAAKQPPTMQAGEADTDAKPNVAEMDEDEYDALPESTKRRLRGDAM